MRDSNLCRFFLLLVISLILTLTVKTHAQPEGWSIIQLTDNNYYDGQPQIYGSNVVWAGIDTSSGGMQLKIFFYDGNTTIELSTDNHYFDDYDWFQIYGSSVVWVGSDGNDTEIFFYDGNTITQLTNNLFSDLSPQIYGSNIVWQGWDGNDYEIFLYDGNTTTQLTNNISRDSSPRIHGSNVVWRGRGGYGWDNEIFFYDGNTTTQLTNNSYDDCSPQIYGSNIVWQGGDNGEYEIFFYDGNATAQLTNNLFGGRSPQIHGSNVVWFGYDGNDSEIFFYDGNAVSQLTNNTYSDSWPRIYGSNVVWKGYDGNDYEIFLAKPVLPPVDVEMNFTPEMLNCESEGRWVKAHVTFPEEIYPEEIDVNAPAVAEPAGVESEFIEVYEYSDGQFDVQIYFDRQIFCEALSESEGGFLEVTVRGSLTDGRKFEGSDTIKLKSELWQHRRRNSSGKLKLR